MLTATKLELRNAMARLGAAVSVVTTDGEIKRRSDFVGISDDPAVSMPALAA